jgi:DnaJ-class molecular chaperone
MDYYSTLGLKRGANDDEIKKAYRSLAMKHHPDRGGDEKKFKEISQAYEFLSDPDKRRIIDMGGDPNSQGGGFQGQGPFEFHFGTGNMDDLFGNFGFGGFGGRPLRRNKSLNINVEIDLEDVLHGKTINAEIGVPNGRKKIVTIEVPPGIEHGQQIKYGGMGDNSIPQTPPGDLIVNIFIRPNKQFKREGDSIIYEKSISIVDAILGASIEIQTLDKKNLKIAVPPGTQSDTMLSCRGEGLPNIRSRQRGNLLIKVKVTIPKNLSNDQKQLIEQLRQHGF